jgi:hypothetical protein
VKADPGVEISWSEIEGGHCRAVCQCGAEDRYEEPVARGARLDPYDPSTSSHAGACEHRDTTDPALLRAILKIQDGAAAGYSWGAVHQQRYRLAGSALRPRKATGEDETCCRAAPPILPPAEWRRLYRLEPAPPPADARLVSQVRAGVE